MIPRSKSSVDSPYRAEGNGHDEDDKDVNVQGKSNLSASNLLKVSSNIKNTTVNSSIQVIEIQRYENDIRCQKLYYSWRWYDNATAFWALIGLMVGMLNFEFDAANNMFNFKDENDAMESKRFL